MFSRFILIPPITKQNTKRFYMGCVGDITTERKPARRARFTHNYIEVREDPEDGVLLMKLRGPDPKGGLGPIVVNRHDHVTCVVR